MGAATDAGIVGHEEELLSSAIDVFLSAQLCM